ncbi:MAG: LrgB family protein [Rikenellaceae bacterium]
MDQIINSPIFIISLVLASYLAGCYVVARWRVSILNPILIAIIIVIAVIKSLGIEYESFEKGSELIDFMLGPSVVAIGYVLYDQRRILKERLVSLLASVVTGSIVGVVGVILLCRLLGCDDIITLSLQPKSVTAPIALAISERSGGIGSLTAVSVVISGIIGSIIGPSLLNIVGVKSKSAKGLALGAAAHGIGTAKAFEIGATEGAVSGLAIGLMGVATSLLTPLFEFLFY